MIIDTFNSNRKSIGTRRIKINLNDKGFTVSRRKIGRVIKKYNLVSVIQKININIIQKKLMKNHLNRTFNREQPMEGIGK